MFQPFLHNISVVEEATKVKVAPFCWHLRSNLMYAFNSAAIFSPGHLYIESTTVLSDIRITSIIFMHQDLYIEGLSISFEQVHKSHKYAALQYVVDLGFVWIIRFSCVAYSDGTPGCGAEAVGALC